MTGKLIAHLRHAIFFERVLRGADEQYSRGGDDSRQAVLLLDIEWANIALGQRWAKENAPLSAEAAALCVKYPDAGDKVLDLRQSPSQQIGWLEPALSMARQAGNQASVRNCLNNLGNAHADLGKLQLAAEYYNQALSHLEGSNDRRKEAAVLGNLGCVYTALGEPKRAIEFYQRALKIEREIGNRKGECSDLNNLGLAYAALKEFEHAVDCYRRSLMINQKSEDKRGQWANLSNLGIAYKRSNDLNNALQSYEQALEIAKEFSDKRGMGTCLFNLALLHDKLGRWKAAVKLAASALSLLDAVESPYVISVARKLEEWRSRGIP